MIGLPASFVAPSLFTVGSAVGIAAVSLAILRKSERDDRATAATRWLTYFHRRGDERFAKQLSCASDIQSYVEDDAALVRTALEDLLTCYAQLCCVAPSSAMLGELEAATSRLAAEIHTGGQPAVPDPNQAATIRAQATIDLLGLLAPRRTASRRRRGSQPVAINHPA
jgi:hypothetical protein